MRKNLFIVSFLLVSTLLTAAVKPLKSTVSSADFDSAESLTCGIQEAINSLPPEGGVVRVPIGLHTIRAPIRLHTNISLIGYGRESIIRKDPAFRVKITTDIEKGKKYDYISVADTKKLRVGMELKIYDAKNALPRSPYHRVVITKIDGNKVYLMDTHTIYKARYKPFIATADVLVKRQAYMANAYGMLTPFSNNVISNLTFDGNREGQLINGEKYYMRPSALRSQLRCIPKVGNDTRVSNCWIHSAAEINISLRAGKNTIIENCDIWNAGRQGIHLGSGFMSKIINNNVHHNVESGIFMCMGNFGVIIKGNHVYENDAGISGMGWNARFIKRKCPDGDHWSIISDNIVCNNYHSGICTSQGQFGTSNFIICNNIVANNNVEAVYQVRNYRLTGGISLFNSQDSIIFGNRCFDDWSDWSCGALTTAAKAGDKKLVTKPDSLQPIYPIKDVSPSMQSFRLQLNNGHQSEQVEVISNNRIGTFTLAQPLQFSYPAGTVPTILKSQTWGIVLTGDKTYGNLVYGNHCKGNVYGGILYYNPEGKLFGNLGGTTKINESHSFQRNLFPATRELKVNIEGTYDSSCLHDGQKSLKVTDAKVLKSSPIELKANTRYRFGGWCKVAKGSSEAEIIFAGGKARLTIANGKWGSVSNCMEKFVPEKWLYYESVISENQSRPLTQEMSLTVKKGSAWFAGLFVEELKPYARRPIKLKFQE